MTTNQLTFVLAVGVSLLAGGSAHIVMKRFWAACLAAAVAASLTFHIIVAIMVGYVDGWFFISFFTVLALAFGIAVPVGYVVRRIRKSPV